jgi:hypothetical protein
MDDRTVRAAVERQGDGILTDLPAAKKKAA